MTTGKAHVKGHTRTSKNGKQHYVRSHQREVTWADILNQARGNAKARTVGAAALGTAAFSAITYSLYGLLSLAAAIMCAIAMVSIGFLTWAVKGQTKRRKSWVKRKFGGVLSPRRRAKAWWYSGRRA